MRCAELNDVPVSALWKLDCGAGSLSAGSSPAARSRELFNCEEGPLGVSGAVISDGNSCEESSVRGEDCGEDWGAGSSPGDFDRVPFAADAKAGRLK